MLLRPRIALSLSVLVVGYGLPALGQAVPATPPAPAKPAQQAGNPDEVITQKGAVVPEAPVPEAAEGDPMYAPLATKVPLTLHQQFMEYAVITVGPRALVSPAIGAAIRMIRPRKGYPPEWRRGAQGFFRNYGDGLASKGALQTARFGTAALLHEDFRYRPATTKNPIGRVGSALLFTVVDRSDTGHYRLAVSNFTAAAAGGYVCNAYLPTGYNDPTHADQRALRHFEGFAISNVLREFSPEIFHVTKALHIPFPHLPVAEWWTKLPDAPPRMHR